VERNRVVPSLIDGDLLKAQKEHFKDIMERNVPSIKAGLAQRAEREAGRATTSKVALGQGGQEVHKGRVKKGLSSYLWAYLMKSSLKNNISEFVKLAIIMLIMPVSSVPAERLFSSMNYIKNNRRNRLGELHLNTMVRLFLSRYEINGFPYGKALDIFFDGKARRGTTAQGKNKKRSAGVAFDLGLLDEVFAEDELDD